MHARKDFTSVPIRHLLLCRTTPFEPTGPMCAACIAALTVDDVTKKRKEETTDDEQEQTWRSILRAPEAYRP